jgi:hypothetical protein
MMEIHLMLWKLNQEDRRGLDVGGNVTKFGWKTSWKVSVYCELHQNYLYIVANMIFTSICVSMHKHSFKSEL